MRKVVVSEFMALDGVIEEPAWTAPYWGDDIAKFKFDELFSSDTLLLGRVTYQGFAAAWPTMTDEQGYADRMNSMPKLVASKTLDKAEWNARLIKDNIAEEVNQLKAQSGQNILVFGSGTFVQTLIQQHLIDEYRLLVYPVTVGSGRRFFLEGNKVSLKLVEAKPFKSGAVALTYIPA